MLLQNFDLTPPGHTGGYVFVADCEYACEDLSSTFLYQDLQYPNVSPLCVRYRDMLSGSLAVYCADGVLYLPPVCFQLEQAHNKGRLWKLDHVLSVNRNRESAY